MRRRGGGYGTVDGRSREGKRLVKVFLFEVRIIFKQFAAIRIRGHDLEDAPHCDAHAAKTGMAAHLPWLDSDPVKRLAELHTLIIA